MASDQELKPCPFCGTMPEIGSAEGPNDEDLCWCETDGCPINDYVCSVTAWNTRPTPSKEADALADKLGATLEKIVAICELGMKDAVNKRPAWITEALAAYEKAKEERNGR